MKFLPIALAGLMAFGASVIFTHTPQARAGEPIQVDQPAGDDTANQVLEIPRNCDDPTSAGCDQAGADPAPADPNDDSSTASAANQNDPNDNQGGTAAAPAGSAAAAQVAGQNVGNVQDYQNQALVDGYVSSSVATMGPAMMPEPAYVGRPVLMPAPVPATPFVVNRFVPTFIPAPGPIGMSRPAWMPAARPMGMPMMRPMGMPGGFRLH